MTQSKIISVDQQSLLSRPNLAGYKKSFICAGMLLIAGIGFSGLIQAAGLIAPTGSSVSKLDLKNVKADIGSNSLTLAALLEAQDSGILHAGQIYKLASSAAPSGNQDAQFTSVDNKVVIPALTDSANSYAVTLVVTQTAPAYLFQVLDIKITPKNTSPVPLVVFVNGIKGLPGDAGVAGAKGPTGDVGPKGPAGDAGAKGPSGDAGAKGTKGDIGPMGIKGLTGPTGITNLLAKKGPVGGPYANTVGQLRYWDNNAWSFLNIGANDQQLRVCDGKPKWVTAYDIGQTGPGGGVVFKWTDTCGEKGLEVATTNSLKLITGNIPLYGPTIPADPKDGLPVVSWNDAASAITGFNSTSPGGKNDWKLPSQSDMQALLAVSGNNLYKSKFEAIGLPKITGAVTQYGALWTNDAANATDAYYGDDSSYQILQAPKTNVAGLVRPIRAF